MCLVKIKNQQRFFSISFLLRMAACLRGHSLSDPGMCHRHERTENDVCLQYYFPLYLNIAVPLILNYVLCGVSVGYIDHFRGYVLLG